VKQGVPVAIIGAPNSGKSTLLNALLQEDRAIVSEIPGTTRDTVEETITIDGVLFRFIDTAGLRKHRRHQVEKLGIERSYKKASEASIVVYLGDASR
jgi:tRNA modification GTPase